MKSYPTTPPGLTDDGVAPAWLTARRAATPLPRMTEAGAGDGEGGDAAGGADEDSPGGSNEGTDDAGDGGVSGDSSSDNEEG